ncbi:hypothetical protein V5P93_002845 [Actinokineospora auranticolor]|uniref:Uncharacterized protein n=1 Tax=Actinokineospora auranticolor TaxID=155976 RepID=A0A2S6H0P3_9PSEU|nr:hypothetical protein [Actinokineospora auranticolor]PPK70986.1 hypothetical protein CLV40_101172 [Actinokineospora auranticolor]
MATSVAPTPFPTAFDRPRPRRAATAAVRPATPVRIGLRLRSAIERVLPAITAPTAAAELRAGLAWTAASGETCRITRPVDEVRSAITALRSGDVDTARTALDHALAALLEAPTLPAPRPATSFERRSI